jgi:hypothetical protein
MPAPITMPTVIIVASKMLSVGAGAVLIHRCRFASVCRCNGTSCLRA